GLADLRCPELFEGLGNFCRRKVALECPLLLASSVRANLCCSPRLVTLFVRFCLIEARPQIHSSREIRPTEGNRPTRSKRLKMSTKIWDYCQTAGDFVQTGS